MTLKTTKPGIDPDEFIKGAKADRPGDVQSLLMMSCSQKTIRPFRLSYLSHYGLLLLKKLRPPGLACTTIYLLPLKKKFRDNFFKALLPI